MDLCTHAARSITRAANKHSKLNAEVLSLEGMSGRLGRHLLNNLVNFDGARYLEVGCWKGSTAVSALYGNTAHHWVIDNWSLFGGPKDECCKTFSRFLGKPMNHIDSDAFTLNPLDAGISGVNVYFYDGSHEEEDQYRALTHYVQVLSDKFVYVVDDYNYIPVQIGTRRAIADLGLSVEFEQVLYSETGDADTWWNSMHVLVLQKPANSHEP